MANVIKLKNSGTANSAPTSLEVGELAVNYADGKIYYKNTSNAVVEFTGATGATGTAGIGAPLTSSATAPVSPSAGDLWFDTTTGASYIYYNSAWVELGGGTMSPYQATSTTRPSSPWTGQHVYETDTNLEYVYNGSAWQQVAGGTAVGNSGLVYVAGGALSSTATNFAGCFTTTYENYRIEFSKVNVGTGWLQFQMLNSTTPFASSLYHSAFASNNSSSGSPASDRGTAITVGYLGYNFQSTTDGSMSSSFDFMNPFGTGRTFFVGQASSYYSVTPFFQQMSGGGGIDSTNSFDGIRISSSGGGTLIGNVSIYGYRKA